MFANTLRIALSIFSGWGSSILFDLVANDRIGNTHQAHHVVISITWATVTCALIAISIRKGE